MAGTSIKTWLPLPPSMSIFATSGNALYFGLSPFLGSPSGTLNGWKELRSTKVTPDPCGCPLVLIVRTIAPKTPSTTPYLTTRCHKLPNPQSANFGILLKASLPARHIGSSSPSLQIYDEDLTKDLKPTATTIFVGILALEP